MSFYLSCGSEAVWLGWFISTFEEEIFTLPGSPLNRDVWFWYLFLLV